MNSPLYAKRQYHINQVRDLQNKIFRLQRLIAIEKQTIGHLNMEIDKHEKLKRRRLIA